jgi:hypothetical protein
MLNWDTHSYIHKYLKKIFQGQMLQRNISNNRWRRKKVLQHGIKQYANFVSDNERY